MSDTATPEGTPAGEPTPVVTDTPLEPTPKTYDENYVKGLRDEAAAARIAKRDAVTAAENALKEAHARELAERDTRYTELENSLGQSWIELQKVYTALDANVPSNKVRQFVAILQGSDEESIGASAKSSLDLIGGFDTKGPAFDPSQGRGGKPPIPLNGDPILAALTAAVSGKRPGK
ncbi:scaffolding protein [Mycobacterium phage Charm]|nr:scaffolding protein [Mycobacterium phage Charm]QGJ88295.1 scaffolding protein [Mycobacterium phage DreamTeam1]